MFSVKSKHVDFSDDWEEYTAVCPYCLGERHQISSSETWKWGHLAERVKLCEHLDISVFAARRETPPGELASILSDELDNYFADVESAECEECDGVGYLELMWNHVWAIDKSVSDSQKRAVSDAGCIVVTDRDGDEWLTLGGCGMDMTPYLCHAWLELGFKWLPLEWISSLSDSNYIEACKSEEVAARIRTAIDYTLETAISRMVSMKEYNAGVNNG